MPTHAILGGKVKLYRRDDGGENWFCSTYFRGKNRRKSTKTDSLSQAQEIAEDWFLELSGKARAGLPIAEGKPFGAAAKAFMTDYEASVEGQRSPRWINEHKAHIENHLKPFFGKSTVLQIDQDRAQEYRLHRFKNPYVRKPAEGAEDKPKPAPRPTAQKTVENEIITLRMILKFCVRKGWLKASPTFHRHTRNRRRSGTGRGSARKNTRSSTRRPARTKTEMTCGIGSGGTPSNFTTSSCCSPIRVCARTR